MKKPILPDTIDAVMVSVASGVMISVLLIFALHLLSTTNPEDKHPFSTSNFAQVFRSPF